MEAKSPTDTFYPGWITVHEDCSCMTQMGIPFCLCTCASMPAHKMPAEHTLMRLLASLHYICPCLHCLSLLMQHQPQSIQFFYFRDIPSHCCHICEVPWFDLWDKHRIQIWSNSITVQAIGKWTEDFNDSHKRGWGEGSERSEAASETMKASTKKTLAVWTIHWRSLILRSYGGYLTLKLGQCSVSKAGTVINYMISDLFIYFRGQGGSVF